MSDEPEELVELGAKALTTVYGQGGPSKLDRRAVRAVLDAASEAGWVRADCEWSAMVEHHMAERAKVEAERDAARAQADALAEALDELGRAFVRMPDAGFNSKDPRWSWWHSSEEQRDAARVALRAYYTARECE